MENGMLHSASTVHVETCKTKNQKWWWQLVRVKQGSHVSTTLYFQQVLYMYMYILPCLWNPVYTLNI